MIEEFEHKGWWWLPNNPEKKLSGTLRFTPLKGAILQLIGSFEEIEGITTVDDVFEPEILLGESTGGKKITLHKCRETRSTWSFPGYQTSSLWASVVYVGTHFHKSNDIKFAAMYIRYSNLDEWANISGFNIVHPNPKELLIKYKLPEAVQLCEVDDYKIFIEVRSYGSSFSKKKVTIEQKTYVKIAPRQEKSFDQYLSIMHYIQNFLALAVLNPVWRLSIEGLTGEDGLVNVFYKVPIIPTEEEPLKQWEMLFTLSDVHNNIRTLLRNWLEKAEFLRPVQDLYFATLYNAHMSIERRFLNLVQAIEAYHRRTMNNFELPDSEHQERIQEILNAVPDVLRSWLDNKLAYSNEPGLRKRLKEIIEIFDELLKLFIPKKGYFISKTVTTRNYLTHYDEGLEEKSTKGMDLFRLTDKLKIILELSFLKGMGFTDDDLKKIIANNRKYQYQMRQQYI